MIDIAQISEKRLALLELNSIRYCIKTTYGDNVPIDVMTRFAELAKSYRDKYGSSARKPKDDLELLTFCTKNALPLT